MDNQTIAVALIVSVIAPVILSVLTGRQRREEKREEWARQDEVAARVQKVAETTAENQAKTAETLSQIHTLVNSDMTAARTAELTATRLLVASLRKNPDDSETRKAIEDGEARITELQQILADRLVAQKKVEADALAAAKATKKK